MADFSCEKKSKRTKFIQTVIWRDNENCCENSLIKVETMVSSNDMIWKTLCNKNINEIKLNSITSFLLFFLQQSLCSEIGEELRFAVRCFDSSSKPVHRKPSYDVTDNGLQSMPLNSYKNNGRNDIGFN